MFSLRGFPSAILFAFFFVSASASDCSGTCGAVNVPFPFGFSPRCRIPLYCTTNASAGPPEIHLDGGFVVRNITAKSLLVDVPPDCHRPVADVHWLFGPNYAMTWENGLLLRNCRSNLSSCVIPTALLASRLDPGSCSASGDNVSCYSGGSAAGFLAYADVTATGCRSLFTAVAYDAGELPSPSLALRTAELEWWLEGGCRCSADANCTRLTSPVTGKRAFRCSCHEGFVGDGFTDGSGCHKAATRCKASTYLSGKCGGTTRVGILVGGILAGASITAVLAVICFFIRRRSTSSRIRKATRHLLSQASCTVPLYTYKDIEKATNCFSDSQRLGNGAFGTVYAGKLNNDKLVAIKKIRHRDAEGIEQVMNEIRLLSSVSHPNLVQLLGCCIERGEQILVFEFMPNGTLSQHLQKERGRGLPWTIRLTIAAETAKAIAHLHSMIHPPIFHRDIKSSNILLDYNFNSKLADFGLSRIGMMESSHISTAPQGTPGYLDPQYHQNFHLSDKSDVYSFGVVLVEIITALKVVDFNRVQSEVNLAALAVDRIGKGAVEEIIDPFLDVHRDAWTLSSIHKVAELAFRCLAFHKDMRPSMMEVADELEQIRLSGWVPSDENVFLSSASSLCSSMSNGTNRSRETSKNRRLVSANLATVEPKLDSPVSVQDSWFSEQSSPSANSLLGRVTR